MKMRQRFLIKPGSNLADVSQLPMVVCSQQQRAEMFPRTRGRRVTNNQELVLLMHLHLQPLVGTSLDIRSGRIFRNQALVALPPGHFERLQTIARQKDRSKNTVAASTRFSQQFIQ